MAKKLKKLVILHSNDIHADFFSEDQDGKSIGGISRLSGYVKKVRAEEENVLYLIAGDLFNGSVIDSEYQGISTLAVINHLKPDAVCVGNHEVDYGISHTLFVEKCANFPLLNANIFIKRINNRLYTPYTLLDKAGKRIIVIGVTTEKIVGALKNDASVGKYIEVHDPVEEIYEAFKRNEDKDIPIDFVIILSHIGYEDDLKLADRVGGGPHKIDLIIGGHSHTLLTEPTVQNGIPVVQAGTGTNQIGRFDIYFDEETGEMDHYDWYTVPIDAEHCPEDEEVNKLLDFAKGETDKKYNRLICKLSRALENTSRARVTEVGAFLSDILQKSCLVDLFIMSPGALRATALGPEVTYGDLMELFPYESEVYKLSISGKRLRQMFKHALNRAANDPVQSSMLQISENVNAVYDKNSDKLNSLKCRGEEVEDDRIYTVAMTKYSLNSSEKYFGIAPDKLSEECKAEKIASGDRSLIGSEIEKYAEVGEIFNNRVKIIV